MKRGLSKHATPQERQKEEEFKRTRNKELHKEHRAFMGRLEKEKADRSRLESGGSIVVQRHARGWIVRRGWETSHCKTVKKAREAGRLLMNTKARLTRDLLEMTEAVGLPPIPGMTMDSKKMLDRQKVEDEIMEEEVSLFLRLLSFLLSVVFS